MAKKADTKGLNKAALARQAARTKKANTRSDTADDILNRVFSKKGKGKLDLETSPIEYDTDRVSTSVA
jgi:hypothetical protein